MYRSLLICCLFYIISFSTFGQGSNPADAIIGTYWSPDKDAKISIYKENNQYFGKTIWTRVAGIDTLNPDPIKARRDLVGLVLLENFVYKDQKWQGGTIYDPKSGNTYQCKMWLEEQHLKARGFIGISLFGRTELFRRFED